MSEPLKIYSPLHFEPFIKVAISGTSQGVETDYAPQGPSSVVGNTVIYILYGFSKSGTKIS